MNDITTFARKELEHEVWSKQDYAEYYQLMHSLITTIESQKEEISELKNRLNLVIYQKPQSEIQEGDK